MNISSLIDLINSAFAEFDGCEVNTSNYHHDDVCNLNNGYVALFQTLESIKAKLVNANVQNTLDAAAVHLPDHLQSREISAVDGQHALEYLISGTITEHLRNKDFAKTGVEARPIANAIYDVLRPYLRTVGPVNIEVQNDRVCVGGRWFVAAEKTKDPSQNRDSSAVEHFERCPKDPDDMKGLCAAIEAFHSCDNDPGMFLSPYPAIYRMGKAIAAYRSTSEPAMSAVSLKKCGDALAKEWNLAYSPATLKSGVKAVLDAAGVQYAE